jgi:transcriptional regulator with GAF, ATPase, and Fis domain
MKQHYSSGVQPNGRRWLALVDRAWVNGDLLVTSAVIVTVGLATVVTFALTGNALALRLWPWGSTETALVAAPFVAILLLCFQFASQRRVMQLQQEIGVLQEESAQRLKLYHERVLTVLRIGHIAGSETNQQAVLDGITRACLALFDCEQASLMLLDRTTRELVVRSACGHRDMSLVLGARQQMGQGLAGMVAAQGQALLLGAEVVGQPTASQSKLQGLSRSLIVPIIVRGELLGVLNVGARSPGSPYVDADLRAVQVFAENVGICIRYAEQTAWMRQTIQNLGKERDAVAPGR